MVLCKNIKIIKRPLFALQTAVVLLLVSCSPLYSQEKEDAIPRDAYVISSIGDARVLLPMLADDATSAGICGLIYNGLTKIGRDLNIVGDLAERWEISGDGLIITFYLKKNVKWHDGAAFTADDVKFSFEKILDTASGSPYISGYTDIKKIEVVDKYTVRFEYKQPYSGALVKLGMGIIPKHIFEKEPDIRRSVYARAPIGTGPYRFSKWESGQYMILEANEGYFEHAPGIKYYVFRIIPDQSVEFLELVSGGIDAMRLNSYQYKYRSETPEFSGRINKYSTLAPTYTYIGYNLKDPVLSDLRVRKALSYAINKKELIDAALFGFGEPCTGPFRKDSVYYDQSVTMYEYDPEKAKTLLAEAGWKDTDGDGILEKDGKEFRIELVTNQGNQEREDVATIVQREWAKVGVKMEIKVVAWAAFLDQFIDKKKFQAILLAWVIPIDPDLYAVWHSDSIENGGLNSISYSNKEVDKLIEASRRELNVEKNAAICHKIHRILAEEAPYTFLFFGYSQIGINKRFSGVDPAPAGVGYNFEDWYVDEKEVKYKF